ncbi:uncharacterized protein BDV17DRAFT_249325 [Aspergillus undulatus]|uniref:uncharacterized protein n=1 Tax=Aspergillus undulatus TaxID=1810928 RepID=UPI003CCDAB95
MGNCHSSQDIRGQHAVPAHPRSIGATPATPASAPAPATATSSKSLHSHVGSSQPSHQLSSSTASDMWSPPPYSSSSTSHPTPAPAPSSSTAIDPNDTQYAFLSTFDTVFLVDDSTSMHGKRWREAEDAIAAIAPICTHYDADGIDIYFLNYRNKIRSASSGENKAGGYMNVTDAAGVREIFKSVRPNGATPVGTRLHNILAPYMRELTRATGQGREDEVKPLNIIVITDGVFTDDAESIIVDVARRLDSAAVQAVPWQVGIQFFQVGDDKSAMQYLQTLDDELTKRRSYDGIRDIVDTVPWKGERGQVLNAEGILKCVLGAVNKKYDKKEATR